MEDARLETLMNSRVLAVRCGVGRAWRELAQMDVTRGRKTIRTIAASVDCKLRAVEEIEQARYEMGVAGTLRRCFEMVGQQASDIPDSGRTTMDEVMMAVGRGGKKVVMVNDVQLFRKNNPKLAHITVVVHFNRFAQGLGPYFVIPSLKRLPAELIFVQQGLAHFAVSKKGWVTERIFNDWMQKCVDWVNERGCRPVNEERVRSSWTTR
jgi:hypothetical protein